MFALRTAKDELVRSVRTGKILTYTEYRFAEMGARALRKTYGRLAVVRV